ncbi:MAG: hypothetical protein ABIG71_02825 [Candidatus Uhrbacteria bacterium]
MVFDVAVAVLYSAIGGILADVVWRIHGQRAIALVLLAMSLLLSPLILSTPFSLPPVIVFGIAGFGLSAAVLIWRDHRIRRTMTRS